MKHPTKEIAKLELEGWAKQPVSSIQRFPTGNHHYVYDAILADARPIVIRMAITSEHAAMAGALCWNEQLRALGLPLPEIYFSNLEHQFPYLIMDRLPGNDLGLVLDSLTIQQLELLAKQLMDFQRQVGKLESAGRYGYSATPQAAPYASWANVVSASLERSKQRILEAAFVDISCIYRVQKLLDYYRPQLEKIAVTPFLYDITTKNVILHEGKLSGIVDVDNLCYGDPLFHIALTQMGILSQQGDTKYIEQLLKAFGEHSINLLRFYTSICCVDFLSELGQQFNGNAVEQSESRKNYLLSILDSLLLTI